MLELVVGARDGFGKRLEDLLDDGKDEAVEDVKESVLRERESFC